MTDRNKHASKQKGTPRYCVVCRCNFDPSVKVPPVSYETVEADGRDRFRFFQW